MTEQTDPAQTQPETAAQAQPEGGQVASVENSASTPGALDTASAASVEPLAGPPDETVAAARYGEFDPDEEIVDEVFDPVPDEMHPSRQPVALRPTPAGPASGPVSKSRA